MRRQLEPVDVEGHPRWPQIVLACPNNVNPAARPIPPDGHDEQASVSEVAGRVGGIGVPG